MGGFQLGDHASGTDAGGAARDFDLIERALNIGYEVDFLRTGLARGRGIQGVHVSEQHEGVRAHDIRHQRGQAVVVTEPDFVIRQSIVLVDDRHDAQIKQTIQGALRVVVLRRPDCVLRGDEDLADPDTETAERHLIPGHEQSLADGCARLLRRDIGRPTFEAERPESGSDSAR